MSRTFPEFASDWSGRLFLGHRKIIFSGTAGIAKNQQIHGLKICIALSGDFELSTNSGVRDKTCSAVIINAGVTHTIECKGNQVYLFYLLPESLSARNIRKEFLYDGRGNFYDIPKTLIEQFLPLQQIEKGYLLWNCQDAFNICDKVIAGLGKMRHRQFSSSSSLCDELGENVKRTIENIYAQIEAQILSGKFNKAKFTPSSLCAGSCKSEVEIKRFESIFKKETGISIEHFSRDLRMLAALKLYAVKELFRKTQEEKLLAALEDPTLTDEERSEIGKEIEALPRGVFLQDIAESLGFGSLPLFDYIIKSRLGISLTDLRGNTDFNSCLEKTNDKNP